MTNDEAIGTRPGTHDSARPNRSELEPALELAHATAARFLADIDERRLLAPDPHTAIEHLAGPLPDDGLGTQHALRTLIDAAEGSLVASAGPRCFHWVIGGNTPAALAADWLTAAWDQVASSWTGSPLGVAVEQIAVDWLRELFGLRRGDARAGGLFTTGAHMANVTCLGAARQWWGERHGVDIGRDGLCRLPPMPIFGSGLVHASIGKALAMLGHGRRAVRTFAADNTGRIDVAALRAALSAQAGAPAVLIGNAGDVNTGAFDPIEQLADLAAEFGAWLHVDGAFGLFARVSERSAELARGVERADSIATDCHKWLNVPYDCGLALVRDRALCAKTFRMIADYLPPALDADDAQRSVPSNQGPESSRRARGIAVWASLAAYGRRGVRALVEHHLDLAQHLAKLVDAAPDLERLADVPLNIVCFRFHPRGASRGDLDDLNARLGRALLADGRVYVGTTRYRGHVCLRPAIVNWRTEAADVELLVDVVRELGAGLTTA